MFNKTKKTLNKIKKKALKVFAEYKNSFRKK